MRHGAWLAVMTLMLGCATASANRGDTVRIKRAEGRLEGVSNGEPVRLEIQKDRITGAFRGRAVDLTVQPGQAGTVVRGDFGGVRADYVFTTDRLDGFIGGCDFTYGEDSAGELYGENRCAGGRSVLTALEVPDSVWKRSQTEQAAWVGLILAQSAPADVRSLAGAQFIVSSLNDRRR